MDAPNVTFAPRDRLGPYELLLELASGGMAAVGLALRHGAGGFERLVVVKRVHRRFLDNESFLHMFRDEARLASSIRHPNVVPVIDVVEMPGELLLVMEYVESVSLAALLKLAAARREAVPPAVVGAIVGDALAGLHGAHEAVDLRRNKLLIVHRDVSPQNIIVGVDGVTRVIDFGIAKAADRLTSTRDGVLKGKFAYMSPEQVEAMPLDRRSDVFSAAVVLHEALTGARLFEGKTELAIMHEVMTAAIPPPSASVPGLPPAVDDVVLAALQRDPEQRFQSALAFHNALDTALPPARPREVAAWVERVAAPELDALGARLQAVLGDDFEKLSPRHHTGMQRSASARIAPASAARRPSAPAPLPAPTPAPTLASPERASSASSAPLRGSAPASARGGSFPGDESVPGVPRRAPRSTLVVVLVAVGALAAGAAAAFGVSLAERARAAAPSLPSGAPSPAPSAAPPPESAPAPERSAPQKAEPSSAAPRAGSAPGARPRPHSKELAPNPY